MIWSRLALIAGLVLIAFAAGRSTTSAAPLGYPWFNNESDVRRAFNNEEVKVFNFVTSRLILMKDHPNDAVKNVGDLFAQQLLEEFGLIEVGNDPATEPSFASERKIVRDILFRISPPIDGGNADVVWDALKATIIIIEPTP